ncbi:MAG: single-stranded DNA-binding protein [Candidatus Kapaibacteriales bacterium]
MSRSYNKVILIGNVGTEPATRQTPSGSTITYFRLATSEIYRTKDGKQEERTDWHTIVAWRGLADIIPKIVRKGSRIFIEGSLRSRDITDSFGNRKQVVEVVADNLLLLDGRKVKGELEVTKEENYIEDSDFDFSELDTEPEKL